MMHIACGGFLSEEEFMRSLRSTFLCPRCDEPLFDKKDFPLEL